MTLAEIIASYGWLRVTWPGSDVQGVSAPSGIMLDLLRRELSDAVMGSRVHTVGVADGLCRVIDADDHGTLADILEATPPLERVTLGEVTAAQLAEGRVYVRVGGAMPRRVSRLARDIGYRLRLVTEEDDRRWASIRDEVFVTGAGDGGHRPGVAQYEEEVRSDG